MNNKKQEEDGRLSSYGYFFYEMSKEEQKSYIRGLLTAQNGERKRFSFHDNVMRDNALIFRVKHLCYYDIYINFWKGGLQEIIYSKNKKVVWSKDEDSYQGWGTIDIVHDIVMRDFYMASNEPS